MDRRITVIASALIALLAIVASGAGLFMNGLYKNDTKSGAVQEQGNDLVTLVLSVPLFVVSAYYAAKGSLRGRLVWTGMLFYFLYTYAMMSFMTTYNQLFLVYVAIYSLSLGASLLTLDVNMVKQSLAGAPVKSAASFMFLMSLVLTLMWLGILVPLGLITGYLLLKRNAWGYALASVVLIKGATYGTAVLSMALFQVLNGIEIFVPFAVALIVLVLAAVALNIVFYGKMKAPASAGTV